MKNAIILKELSENKIDRVIVNDEFRAGAITFCWGESAWFTITNGDDSSNTGFNCGLGKFK